MFSSNSAKNVPYSLHYTLRDCPATSAYRSWPPHQQILNSQTQPWTKVVISYLSISILIQMTTRTRSTRPNILAARSNTMWNLASSPSSGILKRICLNGCDAKRNATPWNSSETPFIVLVQPGLLLNGRKRPCMSVLEAILGGNLRTRRRPTGKSKKARRPSTWPASLSRAILVPPRCVAGTHCQRLHYRTFHCIKS
ncbi:hypothetical protein K474DRAFT_61418 [Panus rudis PR-1116 ss-1]|nr:hypothetical protein K474DRAFT_61418 [Panus rudis PR-1116 ss-1]